MDEYNVNLAMQGYVGPVDPLNKATDSCSTIIYQAIDLAKQKRYTEAIEFLEKSVEQNPAWIPLLLMLARLYLETKQPSKAQQAILRLHELGYKSAELSVMLGAVWMRKRQFGEAILCLREAKVLGAPSGEWLLVLAEALLRTGRLVEAEAMLEDLKERVLKERSRLFLNLSKLRLQQKRYPEAVDCALEAMRAKPFKTTVYYILGLALMRHGENEKAVKAFEEYAEREPRWVATYRFLERLAREAGDDSQADDYNVKAREMLENRRLLRVEKRRHAS